jgi:uncharacterized protein YegP (UPF0339 family)
VIASFNECTYDGAESQGGTMVVQFKVFLDPHGEWRWELQDTEANALLAKSAVGYATEEACRLAVRVIRLFAATARLAPASSPRTTAEPRS